MENDIKNRFLTLREQNNREIYFYNSSLFNDYVGFIKSHNLYLKEIFIKPADKQQTVKIVQRTKPTMEERGVSWRKVLQKAQNVKNDEFYTRYEDIEKEINMYPAQIWQDKVVFCNCDDAVGDTKTEKDSSAFALFFIRNFSRLKLKRLICTHYNGKVDLFNAGSSAYIFTKDGFEEKKDFPPGWSGSFDSEISLKILHEEADIVCTNPPFSKIIKFWKILIKSGKRFLILANEAKTVHTNFVICFKNKLAWPGHNEVRWFLTSKKELTRAPSYWYTNIAIADRQNYKRLQFMPLEEIPDKYKKYDDSGILLVDRGYIPSDYTDPFAVSTRPILNGILEKGYKIVGERRYDPYIDGKQKFSRVLVQKIV